MPKSQQFMTDEFVAGRSAEANQATVAAGGAIAQGIASGVNEFQQAREQRFRMDSEMANRALRQYDMEVSHQALAFNALNDQKRLAMQQQENEAEIALKGIMRQEYQARMAETTQRGQLNFQLRAWQEQTEQMKLQNEIIKGQLDVQKAAREREAFEETQSKAFIASVTDIAKTLTERAKLYGDDPASMPPALKIALDRSTAAITALQGGAGLSADPEEAARKLLGTTKLPPDMAGPDAEIRATMRMVGENETTLQWAKNPQEFLKFSAALAEVMPSLRTKFPNEPVLRAFLYNASIQSTSWPQLVDALRGYAAK